MRISSQLRASLLAGISLAGLGLVAMSGPARADKIKNPIAVFAGLDKITGRIIAFEASVDETVQFGSLQLTARVCYSRPVDETPQTTTFLEAEEVGADSQYKRLFAGWMFASSPGLNAIEHPVYDVWLTDCKGGRDPEDRIKTPLEQDDADDPPPLAAEAKKPPRPGTALLPPGQRSSGAPLRLPDGTTAGGVPLPPGAVAPRPQPQQRFFPTNAPPARGYDPAGQGR